MKFTKMHGLGNDYVYVSVFDQCVDDPSALARRFSDRHTGIGSDGLVLIGPSEAADVRMEMYNSDGSRAQMCGNGIRCVAKYAVDHGLATGPELRIESDAGVRFAHCQLSDGIVRAVRVEMGCPSFVASSIPIAPGFDRIADCPLDIGGTVYRVTCLALGNPHVVVFVDDLDGVDLAKEGPLLERAPQFPERVNAHFARVDSPTHVTVRTWERGSGATRACGTGACAVCVAGAVTGRTERAITATLPGGDLHIEWSDEDRVFMTGPAVEVFTGDWPG